MTEVNIHPSKVSPLVEARGLTKMFGPVEVLRSVDVDVMPGEVVALLGENGAGKSTLVNILSGGLLPTEGSVSVGGRLGDRRTARRSVAMVHQESSVVPSLTLAENILMSGPMPRLATHRTLSRLASPHLERVGLGHYDPLTLADRLSVPEHQLLEIARALAKQAQVFIFDEPTAALSDAEIDKVHSVVRDLRRSGVAVLYVTHRLGEVDEICDRAIVLRNGKVALDAAVAGVSRSELVAAMLGRELDEVYPPRQGRGGSALMRIREFRSPGMVEPVDLEVAEGETIALVGQVGSGASELLQTLGGARRALTGRIEVRGKQLPRTVRSRHGVVAYCSEDRKRDGIFAGRSVAENVASVALRKASRLSLVSRRKERDLAREVAAAFAIDPKRIGTSADRLSGGNQQKVALGKWLVVAPQVILVNEPTRGVDIGARAEIYRALRGLTERGTAIIFATSDIPEAIGVGDRVVSFYRGRIVAIDEAAGIDANTILANVTHAPASEAA